MDPMSTVPKMEARTTSGAAGRVSHSNATPRRIIVDERARLAEDPFFYGHRWVDGEQVPLTREDLLDPQEGDYVSEHSLHHWVARKVCEILDHLFRSRGKTDVFVGGNLKMLWRDKSISRCAPDALVVPGVDRKRGRKSFREEEEGASPVFVLEITSEATSNTDYDDKPGVYERARVREFFLLDTLVSPWTLEGRRLHPGTGRYRKLRPDKDGRLLAESLQVLFAVGADGRSFDLVDALTGEKLRDLHAAEEKLRAAEEKIRQLEAQLAQHDVKP